jgi:hypothetical protein
VRIKAGSPPGPDSGTWRLDLEQSPHPECRPTCGERNHAFCVGLKVCGPGEPHELRAHDQRRQLDGRMVRARRERARPHRELRAGRSAQWVLSAYFWNLPTDKGS